MHGLCKPGYVPSPPVFSPSDYSWKAAQQTEPRFSVVGNRRQAVKAFYVKLFAAASLPKAVLRLLTSGGARHSVIGQPQLPADRLNNFVDSRPHLHYQLDCPCLIRAIEKLPE